MRSRVGWQIWATERLMDAARNYLFPLYASLLTPVVAADAWRESGPRHRDLDGAADTEVHRRSRTARSWPTTPWCASYELGGGWIHVAKATIGKRAFLGNSGITQPGRRGARTTGWSRCCPRAPHKAKARARRGSAARRFGCGASRPRPTRCARFHPSARLKILRSLVETCRLVPLVVTFAIGVASAAGTLQWLAVSWAGCGPALASGVRAADGGRGRGRVSP